jgi:phosphoketolase
MHQVPRILKLLSTVQADLVRPLLDREHTTALAVTASEGELEN